MILDTRRGRAWWSERRLFQNDRLSRLLLFFSEQLEEPSDPGFPVPVGTGGETFVPVDVGLRVFEDEVLELVPSSPPPPEDVTSLAIGPPGKTYSTLGS